MIKNNDVPPWGLLVAVIVFGLFLVIEVNKYLGAASP
jgi:hypothetical protein